MYDTIDIFYEFFEEDDLNAEDRFTSVFPKGYPAVTVTLGDGAAF